MNASEAFIFLDFDGVLNDGASIDEIMPARPRLLPKQIELLNDLVRKARAAIVLTTAWRVGRTVYELREFLEKAGLKRVHRVIAVTPDLPNGPRGREILKWRSFSPTRFELPFVILDDLEDMAELSPYLVRTDPDVGLTKQDVTLALSILKAQKQ